MCRHGFAAAFEAIDECQGMHDAMARGNNTLNRFERGGAGGDHIFDDDDITA